MLSTKCTIFIVLLVGVNKEEFDDMTMYGMEYVKTIYAQQTKLNNNYTNTKYKLLKKKAAMWFTKIRGSSHLTPKHVNIRIKGNNQRNKNIKITAVKYRLNKEIRFLYKKNRG
jgi:hypothetical protein